MSFQPPTEPIRWRMHVRAARERVFQALSTDAGRASFWAESAVERDSVIHFVFPGQLTWSANVLESRAPEHYSVRYYGGSITTFDLADDSAGGTELVLTDAGVPDQDRAEVIAGWVSVLMALKAAVEFGVDLRGHDAQRHWGRVTLRTEPRRSGMRPSYRRGAIPARIPLDLRRASRLASPASPSPPSLPRSNSEAEKERETLEQETSPVKRSLLAKGIQPVARSLVSRTGRWHAIRHEAPPS